MRPTATEGALELDETDAFGSSSSQPTAPPSEVSSNSVGQTTEPLPRCSPAPTTTGSPTTIVEVVDLINGLPKPVTLPCFLQSLDRPLGLLATSSIVSAQPAQGQDNPRLFIISDTLSLSVVPQGAASQLLELGELTAPNRSIKAEIEFPITEPLDLDAPFRRIQRSAGQTICYSCHYPEEPASDYPVAGAFDSTAYRPIPRYEINFDYVEYQFTTCDHATQPERCALLAAIFDQGQVSRREFPVDMPTFE